MTNKAHVYLHDDELWEELTEERKNGDRALAELLLRHGLGDIAARIMDPWNAADGKLLARAEGLSYLDDRRAIPLLVRLLDDENANQRYCAAEALATLEGGEDALVDAVCDGSERAAAAAAWGIAILGDHNIAMMHMRAHGRDLVPRFVVLGAPGIRTLCRADPSVFPKDALDEAARAIARRPRYRLHLMDLVQDGSELAERALAHMDAQLRTSEERLIATLLAEDPP